MRAYLQGYLHGQNDGYHSTLIENKMMDESYDGNLNVEYAPIDQVLEIIDKQTCCGRLSAQEFRAAVEALRGEQE